MDEDTVTLAEQATLGSLLLEPAHIDHVRAWLRPGDFADWWHAQVYTAILERRAASGHDLVGSVLVSPSSAASASSLHQP